MNKICNYFLLLLIFTMSSCNETPSSNEIKEPAYYENYKIETGENIINIGIQPLYLPTSLFTELVARDKILEKKLDSLGFKTNFYKFLNGKDIGKFISEKKILIGVGGDLPALSAIAKNDFVVQMCVQDGNVSYISSKPFMMQDLINKKIGVTEGSISHYGIIQLLKVQNSYENNQIVFAGLAELVKKLNNNELDIIGLWEPYASNVLKQNKKYSVVSKVNSTGFMYMDKNFTDKNPEASKIIVSSFLRAWNYLKSDRKRLLKVCESNLKEIKTLTEDSIALLPQEISEIANDDIFKNYSYSNISSEELKVGRRLNQEYNFVLSEKVIKSDKDWEQIIEHFDIQSVQEILRNQDIYEITVYDYKQ